MTEILPIGWSAFRNLNAEDQTVFTTALAGEAGVKYTAVLVATRIMNGTNHCFLGIGEVFSAARSSIAALVYTLTSADGYISLVEIKRIRP